MRTIVSLILIMFVAAQPAHAHKFFRHHQESRRMEECRKACAHNGGDTSCCFKHTAKCCKVKG